MSGLSNFEINKRWPAANEELLQLYSLPTPNGIKVSAMLEEIALPYEPHFVDFSASDQTTPEFLSLSPNNKIPAIIDPNGPDGRMVSLFESGAILIYLAEKSGQFLSSDPIQRYQTLQWLMFQMGGLGPMFGQLGFFVKFAGKEIEDPRPRQRYIDEAERLLNVLELHLEGREYLVDDYSIADIATAPWLRTLTAFYEAQDLVNWGDLVNVPAYVDRILARPAMQRGIKIPARP